MLRTSSDLLKPIREKVEAGQRLRVATNAGGQPAEVELLAGVAQLAAGPREVGDVPARARGEDRDSHTASFSHPTPNLQGALPTRQAARAGATGVDEDRVS